MTQRQIETIQELEAMQRSVSAAAEVVVERANELLGTFREYSRSLEPKLLELEALRASLGKSLEVHRVMAEAYKRDAPALLHTLP